MLVGQSMDPARRAQMRLKGFPQLVADCGLPAVEYAKCVLVQENLKQNACLKEFQQFKNCLHKAARRAGTRL